MHGHIRPGPNHVVYMRARCHSVSAPSSGLRVRACVRACVCGGRAAAAMVGWARVRTCGLLVAAFAAGLAQGGVLDKVKLSLRCINTVQQLFIPAPKDEAACKQDVRMINAELGTSVGCKPFADDSSKNQFLMTFAANSDGSTVCPEDAKVLNYAVGASLVCEEASSNGGEGSEVILAARNTADCEHGVSALRRYMLLKELHNSTGVVEASDDSSLIKRMDDLEKTKTDLTATKKVTDDLSSLSQKVRRQHGCGRPCGWCGWCDCWCA